MHCVPFLCTLVSKTPYSRDLNTKQCKIMYPMG